MLHQMQELGRDQFTDGESRGIIWYFLMGRWICLLDSSCCETVTFGSVGAQLPRKRLSVQETTSALRQTLLSARQVVHDEDGGVGVGQLAAGHHRNWTEIQNCYRSFQPMVVALNDAAWDSTRCSSVCSEVLDLVPFVDSAALLAKWKNRIVYVHIKGKEIGSSMTFFRFWSKYPIINFFLFLFFFNFANLNKTPSHETDTWVLTHFLLVSRKHRSWNLRLACDRMHLQHLQHLQLPGGVFDR